MKATSLKNRDDQQIDVAPGIRIHKNILQQPREELFEEPEENKQNKHSKCYVANIFIRGNVTTALIDTGAEVTCISEEWYS